MAGRNRNAVVGYEEGRKKIVCKIEFSHHKSQSSEEKLGADGLLKRGKNIAMSEGKEKRSGLVERSSEIAAAAAAAAAGLANHATRLTAIKS
jgi:hypothetical protein